jgi:ferredoxin
MVKFDSLPALIVILLTLLRGRVFCSYFCPAGIAMRWLSYPIIQRKHKGEIIPSRFLRYIRFLPPRQTTLGFLILLAIISFSLIGIQLAYLLSPIAVLSRLFNSFFTGLPIFIFLLWLTFFKPNLWCYKLCPTGNLLKIIPNLTSILRAKRLKLSYYRDSERRYLFITLGVISVLFVISLSFHIFVQKTGLSLIDKRILRPPGATDESIFSKLCIRCLACVKACPTGAINPALLEYGLTNMWTPTFDPSLGFCVKDCIECIKKCPVGAIKKISLQEKEKLKLASVKIKKELCLGYRGEFCLSCVEKCPYGAIKVKREKDKIYPIIIEELCRGCGKCLFSCPVNAIYIQPIEKSKEYN